MNQSTTSKRTSKRPREACYWWLRRRITPGLLNAQYAYFDRLDEVLHAEDRWLELGCGRRITPTWLRDRTHREQRLIEIAGEIVGIDPDEDAIADNPLPIVKHQGYADDVPEADASFDLITANMVFEHMDDPAAVLAESARLLKPGGVLLFHTPNVWYPVTLFAACVPSPIRNRVTGWLEKRPAKDIYPTRYRLNSTGAIRRAATQVGLNVESITQTADSAETVRLGPFVAFELLLIALTRTSLCGGIRSNLIVTLRKPVCPGLQTPQEKTNPHDGDQPQRRNYGAAA